MSERETTSAISKVEGEIEKVAAQIEKVEKQLENKSLPKDEIDYLRKREERLRKEKEQLREKEILILQQNKAALVDVLQSLSVSLQRKAACRMWTGDPTVYNLKATSFQVFDEAVRAKYAYLDNEENISYYVIKQKQDVGSRAYITNDDELDDFFDLAGKPTIYIWPRGSPSLSPASLPSQIEIHLSSTESVSESSGSSRGYVQTLFRQAVRKRDGSKCVLSGEKLRPKAGNVEAAHIFGIQKALASQRDAAGVLNAYDTWNGMLLETSLHVAFDTYLWCMDEFLVVHVSEEGKSKGLQKWEGKLVRLSVDSHTFPSRELLQARFALYNERQIGRQHSRKEADCDD